MPIRKVAQSPWIGAAIRPRLLATGETNHTHPVLMVMTNIHTLDCFAFAYNSLQQWKKIVASDNTLSPDIVEQIEDIIIPALEYIEGWEPSDDDMMSAFGTKWHDGL